MKVALEKGDRTETVEIPDGLTPQQTEEKLRSFYTPDELYGSTDFFQRETYRVEKGRAMVDDGKLWYNHMIGDGRPEEDVFKQSIEINGKFTKENDEKYQAPNWAERFVGATTELAPYMLDTSVHGVMYGESFGMAAATAAAVVGQAGPQALFPEEIATVPGAYAGGKAVGQAFGSWMNATQVESGQLYKSMREDGIDSGTAKAWAIPAGYLIGAVELLQIKQLIPGFGKKGITEFIKTAAKKGIAKNAARFLGQLSKTTLLETGQELSQEGISLLSEFGAAMIQDIQDHEGYQGPTIDEAKNRLKETLVQSLLGFPLLGLPGSIHHTMSLHGRDKFVQRVMTKRGQDAMAVDLAEQIVEATKYDKFEDFEKSMGQEVDDKYADRMGFDNRELFLEEMWNQSRDVKDEDKTIEKLANGEKVKGEVLYSAEQEATDNKTVRPPAIQTVVDTAKLLGTQIKSIVSFDEEKVLNPLNPSDLKILLATGKTTEEIKNAIREGRKFVLLGTHEVHSGGDGSGWSDIKLFRGHTEKDIFHEFAHAVEEQGGLPGWTGTKEEHADFLENILGTGKITDLRQFQNQSAIIAPEVVSDPEDTVAVQPSIRTFEKTKADILEYNSKTHLFGEAQIQKYFSDLDNVAKFIMDNRDLLDFVSADYLNALKDNSDKQYKKSLDFTTMCVKRYIMQNTIDEIQLKLNRPLSSQEFMEIRAILKARGIETSCGACYVDSRRIQMATVIYKAIGELSYGLNIHSTTEKNKGGSFKALPIDEVVKKIDAAKKAGKPTLIDPKYFLTYDGIDRLAREHPDVYTKFRDMFAGTQMKIPEARTEYRSDILKLSQGVVDTMNTASGLRWQSWSDFELPHVLDAMQAIGDMAQKGLKGHAYTKVPLFVKIFAPTGIAINMSMIPKGTGFDKNGNLIWDESQSFPWKEALKLREQYPNVGTVAIGISDEHIKSLLKDPRIDYVIPYHKSGLNAHFMKMVGMETWDDYTDEQSFTGDKIFIGEWEGNMKKLRQLEKERGTLSPFQRMKKWDGYEKLLTDRRFQDNAGNYTTQSVVKPEFDMKEVDKALKDHVDTGGNNYYADKEIVKEFVDRKKEIQTSIRETNYEDLWDASVIKQRIKEGMFPAIKDPRTGKVYKGLLHRQILIDHPELRELRRDGQLPLQYIGFVYKDGEFYSKEEMDKKLEDEIGTQMSIRTTEPATEKYKTKGNLNYLVEESMRVSETMAALEEQKAKRENLGQTTAEIDQRLIELGRQYDVLDSFMAELLIGEGAVASHEAILMKARDLDSLERKLLLVGEKTGEKQQKKLQKQKKAKIDEIKSLLVNYTMENLPKSERGAMVTAISRISTVKQLNKQLVRVDEIAEKSMKRNILYRIKQQLKRIDKSKAIAVDYVGKIKSFMSKFELTGHNKETIESLQATRDYMAKEQAAGRDVTMPSYVLDALEILVRRPISELNSTEMKDILARIEVLADLGKTKLRSRRAAEKLIKARDLATLKASSKKVQSREVKEGNAISGQLNALEKFANGVKKALNFAQMKDLVISPMSVVFDLLDGGKNYTGDNFRIFKQRVDSAYAMYLDAKDEVFKRIDKLVDELDLDKDNMERIGLYAAREQEGGTDKLLTFFTQAQVDSVVLTENEMKFYEAMRKELNDLRPHIEKVMREVYNKPLGNVTNYFPFMMDFDAMSDSDMRDRFGNDVKIHGEALRKNVEMGFSEQRKLGAKYRLKLNASEIFSKHVDNALYLVHVGKHTKYLGELAGTDEYQESVGDVGQEVVRQWIDLLARKGNQEGRVKVLDNIRNYTGVLALGFKLGSALVQVSSLMDGAALIGTRVFEGFAKIMTSKEWRSFVMTEMPAIRDSIGDDPAFTNFKSDGWQGLTKWAYLPLKIVDKAARAGVAVGAYIKYCKDNGIDVDFNNPDSDAIEYAEMMAMRTQSSSMFKDLPLAVTAGKLTGNISVDKIALQFQSFMLNRWSMIRHDLWRAGIRGNNKKQAVSVAMWLIAAQFAENGIRQMTAQMLATLMGQELPDDDDDEDKQLINNLRSVLQNVPFVGSLFSGIVYGDLPIPSISMLGKIFEKISTAVKAGENNPEEKWLKAILTATPGGQQFTKYIKNED